jgi:transcriptional regulator with XRE-family HTH domain
MTKEALKDFRESKDLNQKQLAEYLGVTRQATISDWERGERKIPKWVELRIKAETSKN